MRGSSVLLPSRDADSADPPARPTPTTRRTVGLLAAAVDPNEIASRAGHASVAFTYDRRYGYPLPEVDKQSGAKVEAHRTATRLA